MGAVDAKLEEEGGAAGGLSHGIRKSLHLPWACVLRRVLWEDRVGRVWTGQRKWHWDLWEGPLNPFRAALRIPKAGGIKSTSRKNQCDLELCGFSS